MKNLILFLETGCVTWNYAYKVIGKSIVEEMRKCGILKGSKCNWDDLLKALTRISIKKAKKRGGRNFTSNDLLFV